MEGGTDLLIHLVMARMLGDCGHLSVGWTLTSLTASECRLLDGSSAAAVNQSTYTCHLHGTWVSPSAAAGYCGLPGGCVLRDSGRNSKAFSDLDY